MAGRSSPGGLTVLKRTRRCRTSTVSGSSWLALIPRAAYPPSVGSSLVAADPDDLALALELAEIADSITLERYQAGDLRVETKPDMTPVSEADTAVEQAVRDRLATARPDDGVVGEEFGPDGHSGNSRRWIIDPIDGTKIFVRGGPVWATLLALQDGGETTVGVVSAPALHRRWWASRGGGAHVDDGLRSSPGRQLHASVLGRQLGASSPGRQLHAS